MPDPKVSQTPNINAHRQTD